ncbi:phospholipase A2 inhibitor and Ly6/PLAUR domain-containing protein [Bos mutus]|uniref:phospholipase A2 inhibitor and Ly6/PLAUR domain-containing protein n=1 Tax=Bos mutus TaxID=72004 RepID=UPI0038B6A266
MKPSMKPETLLLATTLLCTLLGLGYPLSCEVCVGDGPNCRGKLQTCALDEDSCIVVVTETNRKASLAVTSYKGCSKSSECESGLFGFTVNHENYMGSKRHCCQKDGCNQDPLPGIKFAARGCGMKTACHTKPGTLVPSGARLFTIKKTSCL